MIMKMIRLLRLACSWGRYVVKNAQNSSYYKVRYGWSSIHNSSTTQNLKKSCKNARALF